MVSQSVLIISWSKVSQCFNNYVCYWMHTDDFNKSSKIVDIFIYILFIISYVSHILLDILWKLLSSPTLSVNGNYLLGYHARLTCSLTLICETLIKFRILYYWHDMIHIRKSQTYYSVIDHLKNRQTEVWRSKYILKACIQRCFWKLT